MAPLTVLTDDNVRSVLDSLTKHDVLDLHTHLADALHSYSTATEASTSGCCATNQPTRIAQKNKNGTTTLFMPARSDTGMGVKIVTLAESKKSASGSTQNLPLRVSTDSSMESPVSPKMTRSGSPVASPRSSSPSALGKESSGSSSSRKDSAASTSTTATAASSATTTSTKDTAASVHDSGEAAPHPTSASSSTSPAGTMTLLTPDGQPRALVAASTLTAFRTALTSTLLLKIRRHMHTLTVFGAGKQAFWHIYLALLLRGNEIHHIHVINRSFDRAQQLYIALARYGNRTVQDVFLEGKLRPSILTPEYGEYNRLLKEHVRAADAIFCCTPSTQPLFPGSHLTSGEGRRKARYIAAVGSYKPHLQELPVEILQQAVRGPGSSNVSSSANSVADDSSSSHSGSSGGHHHFFHIHQKTAGEGGAVVVDSIEGAMTESGEIIKSGIGGEGVVELGELVMLKRSHWAEKRKRAEERERARGDKHSQKEHGHHFGNLFKLHHHQSSEKVGGKATDDKGVVHSHGMVVPEKGPILPPGEIPHGNQGYRPGHTTKKDDVDDGGLFEWLQRGNVVYKSVGIGLMDVVVGMEIVKLAEERGIGTRIEGF